MAVSNQNGGRARFRADAVQVIQRELTRVRSEPDSDVVRYEILTLPHALSPFLTLAEYRGEGLAAYVVKVLLVPAESRGWETVLENECARLEREFRVRLTPERSVKVLRLPLTRFPAEGESLVQLRQLDRLRRRDLLEEGRGVPGEDPVLPYLVRPYIPWPSLREAGYPRAEMRKRWDSFCERHTLPKYLRNQEPCQEQFYDEALVDGDKELIVVSAWRWEYAGGSFNTAS